MFDAPAEDDRQALLALLDYYRALGVDCAVDVDAHDRYAESARPPSAEQRPSLPPRQAGAPAIATVSARQSPPTPLAPQEAARAAQDLAAGAPSLEELRDALAGFDGGGSLVRAKHFMFARGAPAELMALEYAPGESEEASGEPFSGPEGRLLEAMLAAIGRDFGSVYCGYFCPWRPPGGQKLTPHASAALAPFALRHVELARPKTLLVFGESAKSLLPASGALTSLYGQRFELRIGDLSIATVIAPGIAAMLKTPALKPQAWRALRLARSLLD